MTQTDSQPPYDGEERRRRWPGEWPGEERRTFVLELQTDQEPDQSPLADAAAAPQVPALSRETPAAPG